MLLAKHVQKGKRFFESDGIRFSVKGTDCSWADLSFALQLTESGRFRMTTNVAELFYK